MQYGVWCSTVAPSYSMQNREQSFVKALFLQDLFGEETATSAFQDNSFDVISLVLSCAQYGVCILPL